MWTPRRILLLVVGVGLCTAAFVLYNRVLGWIDGLPALPDRYLAAAKPGDAPIEPHGKNRTIQKLQQAFGDGCREEKYNYQTELPAQGLVIAFHQIDFDDAGDVILRPLSIACYGKINSNTGFPEINTIHCDRARIKFTRPVRTYADMGQSKLESAAFFAEPATGGDDKRAGSIYLIHNHSTPQANDDMIVSTKGPVHFVDNAAISPDKPQIWSDSSIDVNDYSGPHRIQADTFRAYLNSNATKSSEPRTGSRNSAFRRVELGQVQMKLEMDQQSDLFAPAAAGPKLASSDKAKLFIRTQGTFVYDVAADHAEFRAGDKTTYLPQYVEVLRDQLRGSSDELRCDRLQLQFKPKSGPSSTPRDSSNSLGLDEVRATGAKVELISVTEQLTAYGTELVYRQQKREAVLRGSPMSAVNKGNRIEAPELFLHRPDPNQPVTSDIIRLGRAPGPGTLYLHEQQGQRMVEVRWNDELLIEREGLQDRVTLSGRPAFEDRVNEQILQGDQIRIWMLPTSPLVKTAAQSPENPKPERLRVTGRVEGRTRELIITETPLLDVCFADFERTLVSTSIAAPVTAQPGPAAAPQLGTPGPVANPAAPPKKPVRLSAEYIRTSVNRQGNLLQLDRVACRKSVRAHQDAENPIDRGLDLRADELDLTRKFDNLNRLELRGTPQAPAHVDVQKLTLEGPKIIVDQSVNLAEVIGPGLAVLQVSSDLNGEKLAQPTEVVIHWLGKMDFRGNRASFHGGVQADHEADKKIGETKKEHQVNRLVCPRMDIYLDKSVSFNPEDRHSSGPRAATDEGPKVKRLVCRRGDDSDPDRLVTVAGNVWRDGKRIRFQQIDAPEVTFENDTREVTATCTERAHGEMRLWSNERTGLEDNSPPPSAGEPTFNLTHIVFRKQMRASERSHSVVFTGSVRAWHGPVNEPMYPVNYEKLLPGAFRLTCQTLEIGQQPSTWMSAEGKADIEGKAVMKGKADSTANDFRGSADKIKYDKDKKQQIILDSSDGNPAALYHIKEKGKPPMEILGRQIIYWRDTNDFRASGTVSASGSK